MLEQNFRDPLRNLLSVNQFTALYPVFTASSLRWLIFNERKNGLKKSGVVVRLGRKVMIDADKFFGWLDAQQSKAA